MVWNGPYLQGIGLPGSILVSEYPLWCNDWDTRLPDTLNTPIPKALLRRKFIMMIIILVNVTSVRG